MFVTVLLLAAKVRDHRSRVPLACGHARMAESADATDLKSVGDLKPLASSSLAPGTFPYTRGTRV